MSKIRAITYSALAFTALATAAIADTVTLKNGEKIQGKILSQTDTQVTIEMQVTATIKDERTLSPGEIASIEKTPPDEKAWSPMSHLEPGSESFTSVDYARIRSVLDDFIVQFPTSQHVSKAKEKLAAFDAEAKRVEAGEVKFGGVWFKKEEAERERLQILGLSLFSQMKRAAEANRLVEAMNIFDRIEKQAPGASSMADAVELARKLIPAISAAAANTKAQIKAREEENKLRLSNLTGADKQRLEQIQKQQAASIAAAVEAAEKSAAPWLPLSPATERSITKIINKATAESSRITRFDLEKMRKSIALTEDARKAMEEKNAAEAVKLLREATAAWPTNEMATRLTPQAAIAVREQAAEAANMAAAKLEQEKAEAAAKKLAKKKQDEEEVLRLAKQSDSSPSQEDPPLFKKPVFWVILFILAALIFAARRTMTRFRDPDHNILDQ